MAEATAVSALPEASSGTLSDFVDRGLTASVSLSLPASEPRPQVLNYLQKAGRGDGLRENETQNNLSTAPFCLGWDF